ncbi:MAG TPA: alanine racemase [Chloroflexia bacterium]|nr:alanine racemase [Chloroflexia bacterium]
MRIWDVDTPALLVDLDRLENNLARMASRCRAAGVKLRPHTKTHKTPEIAWMQLQHGASGICVAKVGEAEVMVAAGIDDIFVVYPVLGPQKYERLLAVMERADVRISLDSYEVAQMASDFFAERKRKLKVLLEMDNGFGRCGLQSAEEACLLAERIAELPGVDLMGVMVFAGHSYRTTTTSQVIQIGRGEGSQAVDVARALRGQGHRIEEVSIGSTPTTPYAARVEGVTEARPGVYVFMDQKQMTLGSATIDDCALMVLATVVSNPRPDRFIVDAGLKALSGDTFGLDNYGVLLEYPEVRVSWASEEHGVIQLRPGQSLPGLHIGAKVRIIPDHACGTTNMHDTILAVRGEQVEEEWKVAGRGKFR